MPQGAQLPPVDALIQFQTITFDFGAGPYLPAGVTLVSNPQVTISVQWGTDDDPDSRIIVPPQIGTAPAPNGSGRTNCAVLFQIGNCPGPLMYLVECTCTASNGDVVTMDCLLPVRVPGTDPPPLGAGV